MSYVIRRPAVTSTNLYDEEDDGDGHEDDEEDGCAVGDDEDGGKERTHGVEPGPDHLRYVCVQIVDVTTTPNRGKPEIYSQMQVINTYML